MKAKYLQTINKALLKIVSILIFIGTFYTNSQAQTTISYSYDGNGNRTSSVGLVIGGDAMVRPNDTTKKDSANTIALNHGITVYPNPTSGQVSVAIASLTSNPQTCQFAMVYLMDASGNVLQTQKATQSPVQMSLVSYNQGVYYIRVVLCGEQLYYKVIKVSPGNSKAPPPTIIK